MSLTAEQHAQIAEAYESATTDKKPFCEDQSGLR
jgi:hypothetical protein